MGSETSGRDCRGGCVSAITLPATRSHLLRTRRRLSRLTKGTDLLRRKREALVTELFRLARPAADARTQIVAAAQLAYPLLIPALADHGMTGLQTIGSPTRDFRVEVAPGSVWGVIVSHIVSRPAVPRTLGARGTTPSTGGLRTTRAATAFEHLAELLLEAAPQEMLLRRVGEALAQTSRQVHTLERRVSPQLEHDIARVRRILDEREREERLRLSNLLRKRRGVGV
jgi:H(+)-transporting ATP synthase subunit D